MVNKKGTASDVLYLASVGFLTLTFGFVLIYYVGTTIFDHMLNAPIIKDTSIANDVLNKGNVLMGNLDAVVLVAFIGLILFFLFTSWFVDAHPVLIIIYFVVGVVSVLASMVASNFWEDLTTGNVLAESVSNMPVANNIMTNLPYYVAVIWILGLVVTFTKPQKKEVMLA